MARIYPDLDPRLVSATGGSMRGHLLKLSGEGRVVAHDERWLLSDAERESSIS